MHVDVLVRPGSAVARVQLELGETFTAETGSMIAMSGGVQIETSSKPRGQGGLLSGLKRMLAGENFFLNHYKATASGQEVFLAPTLIGDVEAVHLAGRKLHVQAGGWLGSSDGVSLETSYQGFGVGMLGGEGFFWVTCGGGGTVLLASFGAIYKVEVDGEYTVDTGHVVAYEDGLQLKVGKANPSLLGSIFGGEGLVCRFSGKGTLWCQSHNAPAFGAAIGPLLSPRKV